jgi:CrcB protein
MLLVGLGGCLGAIGRYKLSGLVFHHWADWRFPLGTCVVNGVGCLAAGIVSGLIERQEWFSPETRIFLLTGVMGGFTTFSAFGVDAVYLLKTRQMGLALAYVGLSVGVGIAALWFGMALIPHRHIAAPGSAGG